MYNVFVFHGININIYYDYHKYVNLFIPHYNIVAPVRKCPINHFHNYKKYLYLIFFQCLVFSHILIGTAESFHVKSLLS
jgi:hypothetical protein